MNEAVLVTIILGILSTIQLHISKAMERQGIEIFDQIRAKMKKKQPEAEKQPVASEKAPVEGGAKKPTIYLIGLILNNTVVVYAILAGPYGIPQLFSGMFGIGLIALMLYSSKVLKEEIMKIEFIGAALIIVGTLILGFEAISRPETEIGQVSVGEVGLCLGIFLGIGAGFMAYAFKKGSPIIVGVIFGLFAGGCGSMDPFLKGIGQNYGTSDAGIFPQNGIGWFFFIVSFFVATSAFVFTQWGFAKKAKASVLVPAYNCTYVILPLIFAWILFGFVFYWTTYLGVILIGIGIVLMRVFKPEVPKNATSGLETAK